MTQKHKWHDVLIAIDEGKEVEFFDSADGWVTLTDSEYLNPLRYSNKEWRIKPEPKPDVELWYYWNNNPSAGICLDSESSQEWKHAIKLTFDAETNEYKSTEVVK